MSNPIYTIKHNHQHLNYITSLLAERPFKESASIIQSIQLQVLQQQGAAKEAEKAKEAANDAAPVTEAAE
jgi:hypothetical protein